MKGNLVGMCLYKVYLFSGKLKMTTATEPSLL